MPKFNRRAAERPAELLDAALGEFYARGFSATKIDDIARRAGVTVGTVYRYFPSKEALFHAVVERQLDSSWSRGRDIAEAYGSMTAREVIGLLLGRWAAVLREPEARQVAILIMREAPLFPETVKLYDEELLQKGRLSIERALRHGIERGEFPLLDVAPTARALLGAPLERVLWQETFGGTEEASELVALLVRGLPRLEQVSLLDPPSPIASSPAEPPLPAGTLRITTLRPPEPR
ncbi:MAG: TetR/AcrR family transcriptional regulator [Gemmatimonadales bacterium]|nr:TetR/AcrR family transcriptional regulator [Gemmatimonadales bacterium]